VPFHAPLAAQDVALVLDQVKVALPPTVILDGVATNETVGTAGGVTEIVADACEEPVAPTQVSEYVVVLVGDTAKEPLVARAPVQPTEELQAVAFLVDQLSVELPPVVMAIGVAVNVTVGIPDG